MKLSSLFALVLFAGIPVCSQTEAVAAPIGTVNYNSPTTAIFGGGNPNGSWTSATSGNTSVELRFKERGTGVMTNDGAGTYSFPVGTFVNLEFSAGTGTQNFSEFKYLLSLDSDPTANTALTTFDPLLLFSDNSWGNGGTANGAGVEGLASTYGSTSSLVQNSERDIWFNFHPAGDALYQMSFSVYAFDDVNYSTPLARTEANLQIGDGTSSVPDTGSTLLMFGFAGLGLMAVNKKSTGKKLNLAMA